jgi:hypothetical protein
MGSNLPVVIEAVKVLESFLGSIISEAKKNGIRRAGDRKRIKVEVEEMYRIAKAHAIGRVSGVHLEELMKAQRQLDSYGLEKDGSLEISMVEHLHKLVKIFDKELEDFQNAI